MNNIIDLKPNMVIGDTYKGVLKLNSWKGFQSKQGFYVSRDKNKDEISDGLVKVFVQGKEIDYVKTTTQQQVNAIRFLVDNSDLVRNALIVGLLNELPSLKDIHEDLIPEINSIKDFKKYIGLANIHVSASDKDDFAYIGFELGCNWDEEHGVGVMMHKDRVVAIGQAETSFDNWVTFEDNGTMEIETENWNESNANPQMKRQVNKREKPWWKFW